MAGNGKNQIEFQVEIIVEPDGDEYHAFCPALKGLHACGETVEGALSNARDAATAYIESLIKHGDPVPVGVLIDVPQTDLRKPGRGKASSRSFKEDLTVATA
jgi:predicted RNase H-like HicB family nuclease